MHLIVSFFIIVCAPPTEIKQSLFLSTLFMFFGNKVAGALLLACIRGIY